MANETMTISERTNVLQYQMNAEDQNLIEKIREGNRDAFATLYGKYKQPIYLFCVRMVSTSAIAEDIFQDLFMKCYENIREGMTITNLKSYLFTSARNRCLNAIRNRKNTFDLEEIPDSYSPIADYDYETAESIQDALQKIPELNREAFLLCEYEGYSYEETAQLTSVPLSTVRKRVFRARQRLRQLLHDDTQN